MRISFALNAIKYLILIISIFSILILSAFTLTILLEGLLELLNLNILYINSINFILCSIVAYKVFQNLVENENSSHSK